MAYKLLDTAEERWRRLNGHQLLPTCAPASKYKDGIRVTDDDNTTTR